MTVQWGAQFFGRLAERLHVDGWNPMIGSIATGNPGEPLIEPELNMIASGRGGSVPDTTATTSSDLR